MIATSPSAVLQLAERALRDLGYRDVRAYPDSGEVTARTGVTLKSFGQYVSVRADAAAVDSSLVSVAARTRFGQVADWGEGAAICDRVLDRLRALADAPP